MFGKRESTARAAKISDRLARALASENVIAGSGELVGIEHEFQVMRAGMQIDFREIIHQLGLGARSLDPLDLNAYHLPSGAALSADYREAEIATPPVQVGPGFAEEVVGRAQVARSELRAALPRTDELIGYSTHISVSIDPALNERVARLYACTFGPALIMLLDRRDSPGLLVRPRTERLELCGEFLDGDRLRAAVAFVVGSALACVKALSGTGSALPSRIRLRVDPGYERYGWYVDRSAAGPDLCAVGRDCRLPLATGETIRAQDHLERCCEIAAAEVAATAADTLASLDAMVRGELPLPSEEPLVARGPIAVPFGAFAASPFARALEPCERDTLALAPVMLTWRTCVLLLVNARRTRRAFICLPRATLERFHRLLDSGELDTLLNDYLALPQTDRRLERVEKTSAPGVYDRLGARQALVPIERRPDAALWAEVA